MGTKPVILVDDRLVALDKAKQQLEARGISVLPILYSAATPKDRLPERVQARAESGEFAIVETPAQLEECVAHYAPHAVGLLTDYDFEPNNYTGAKLAQAVLDDPARFHGLKPLVHSGQGGVVVPNGEGGLKVMPAMLHGLGDVSPGIDIVMKKDPLEMDWVAQQLGIELTKKARRL